MSIAVLVQTYEETRRLAIAGSAVAAGDFRLKKLVPQLAQAGQKAPIFAKVGEAVSRLVESDSKTSAASLLELTALIQAILYTQGATSVEGEWTPIETIDIPRTTSHVSARALKTLHEALTTKGSGRMEVVREAHESGVFEDFRSIGPALAAIDDPHPEIAEYVTEKILPTFGRAIVPELLAAFDPQGRLGQSRRLTLAHQLDPVATRPLVRRALDDGGKEVRIAAIACLGDSSEDLAFLLEQVKSKSKTKPKEAREAALSALGRLAAPEADQVLCEAIGGEDFALAVKPIGARRDAVVTSFLLEAAQEHFDAAFTKKALDDKKLGPWNKRTVLFLKCLQGRDDAKTTKLLLDWFERAEKLAKLKGQPSGKDTLEALIDVMRVGSPKLRGALVDARDALPPDCIEHAFRAAIGIYDAAKVFEIFSPYLHCESEKKHDPARIRRETLIESIVWARRSELSEYDNGEPLELDPRWLDLALEQGHSEWIHALAIRGHADSNAFLTQEFAGRIASRKDDYEAITTLETMIRVGHPGSTDAAIELLRRPGKRWHYGQAWILQWIPKLPPTEAIPKLEAILPALQEHWVDPLLGALAQLKSGENGGPESPL